MGIEAGILGAIGAGVAGASSLAQTGLGVANAMGQKDQQAGYGEGGENAFGGGMFGTPVQTHIQPQRQIMERSIQPMQQPQFANPYMKLGGG